MADSSTSAEKLEVADAALPVGSPLVRSVVHGLVGRIRGKQLRVGDRLAPVRELASDFGVSFRTALSAVEQLEAMGLVERHQGSGTYVSRDPDGWAPAPQAKARSATAVYMVMEHSPEPFRRFLQPLVPVLHENGLVPIPVDISGTDRDVRVFEQLRRHWEHQPPRAIVVKGTYPNLMSLIRKHAPRSTCLIKAYGAMGLGTRGFHSVRPDEIAAYRMAAEHLLDGGHERLGLVAMPRRRMPGDRQFSVTRQTHILAIFEVLAERGLSRACFSAHFHRKTEQDPLGIGDNRRNVERLIRWLTSGPHRPTGIIGMSDRLNSVRFAADLAGLRIGTDIELVGIGDDAPAKQGLFPCVSEQYERVARHMVKLILEHEAGQAIHHLLVPPTLVERQGA